MAELDNFRKRSKRDEEAAVAQATTRLLAAFLPTADNLERALQVAGPDDPQLQANAAELRALIGARIKNATKAKKLDIKRLEKHIVKLKAEIGETESRFDELVEKRFNQLFDVVQDTNSTPKEE